MPKSRSPVIVIGAGIAGFSAAQWLLEYAVPFRWLAADGAIGGTLDVVRNPIDNWPGLSFPDGAAFVTRLREQAESLEIGPERARVTAIRARERRQIEIDLHGGERVLGTRAILATGVAPRTHPAIGEPDDARIFTSSKRACAENGEAEHIAFVGGGDGAAEGALLARAAGVGRATILQHSGELSIQARFRERIEADPQIEVRLDTEVMAAEQSAAGVELDLGDTVLRVDALVVKIGFAPRFPTIEPAPETDAGYLRLDRDGQTTIPGVFAAGDCASPGLQALARAAGQGALAAHAVAVELGFRT